MTNKNGKKLSEKRAGVRSELMFIEGEAKFCSQFFDVLVVKPVAFPNSYSNCLEMQLRLRFNSV